MRRRLFSLASLLSLLLCVATVVLWVQSPLPEHGYMDGIGCVEVQDNFLIYSHWARLSRRSTLWHPVAFGINFSVVPTIERDSVSVFGPVVVANTFSVSVPLWMVVTLTLILPTSWVGYASIRRLRTKSPDRCVKCGYNLTGNTSGVCPECGTAVAGRMGV